MSAKLLLITGPAGAGKTTVAREWASTRSSASVHLQLDTFREFVISGFRNPEQGWNDETQRQLDLARSNVASVTTNYLNEGIQVVVDDAVFPNWAEVGIERWKDELLPLEIDLIVLLPSWDVVVGRNASRTAERILPETMLKTIYDDMAAWRECSDAVVIDNSDLTVSQTAVEIDQALKAKFG